MKNEHKEMQPGRTFRVRIRETLERVVTVHEGELKEATPAQITTAMGTLIDKWTGTGGGGSGVKVELGEMEEYSV